MALLEVHHGAAKEEVGFKFAHFIRQSSHAFPTASDGRLNTVVPGAGGFRKRRAAEHLKRGEVDDKSGDISSSSTSNVDGEAASRGDEINELGTLP